MGDTDIVNAKDKDRIFAPLHAAALVMKRGHRVNRNVSNGRIDLIPVLPAWSEALHYHGIAERHADSTVRSVRMAGGDDMLGQGGMGQVESAVGIGENPSSLG